MFQRLTTAFVAVGSLLLGVASHADAQIRASERSMIAQTVDGTTITVDYSRPRARGRADLFGGIVHWGEVWTPGANWATTFEFSNDVTLNEHDVAAGKYSVWLEVMETGPWTMILDPQPRRFHLGRPAPSDDQVRFPVEPMTTDDFVEVLTWEFPAVSATGTTLHLAWGTTAVAFEIGVPASRVYTVTAEDATPYLGSYRLTTKAPLPAKEQSYVISHDGEHLVAHWDGPPNPILEETWLVPQADGMLIPAFIQDGELFDLVMDLALEFDMGDDPVRMFEMYGPGEVLWGTAERVDP
jgi:hypothetical protein